MGKAMRNSIHSRVGVLIPVLVTAVLSTIWLAIGVYQSHYLSALHLLGDYHASDLIGSPKAGRGDEWSTYLPMLKQAYLEGFPEHSTLPPYHELLNWFISLPHKNLSLLFLPNQLAWFVFPGWFALSFQGLYYNLLFLASGILLLKNLGVRPNIAIGATLMLLFSQFYQMWWTSNFPALGAVLLPFAVFTSNIRWKFKGVLLFWAFAHLIFGEFYPPFYIAAAYGLLPLLFAANPKWFNVKGIVISTVAAIAAVAAYLAINHQFFFDVANTSYPGHRISLGGGVNWLEVASLIMPNLPNTKYGASWNGLYESAAAASALPLLVIAFGKRFTFDKVLRRVLIAYVISNIVMIFYAVYGVPRVFAVVTGLSMVPGTRLIFGISLSMFVLSSILFTRISEYRSMVEAASILAAYAILGIIFSPDKAQTSNFAFIEVYAFVPLCGFALGLLVDVFTGKMNSANSICPSIVMATLVLAHVVVFGSFNPLIKASYIINPVNSLVIRDWKVLWKINHHKYFGMLGSYGHLLRGENLPALSFIHLANVDPAIYRRVYPSIPPDKLDSMFNQFRGLAFANIPHIDSSGATVFFPIRRYGVSFPVKISASGKFVNVLKIDGKPNVVENSTHGYDIYWNGQFTRDVPVDAALSLAAECKLESSWVTRYPLLTASNLDRSESLTGVAGVLTISSRTRAYAEKCAQTISMGATAVSR